MVWFSECCQAYVKSTRRIFLKKDEKGKVHKGHVKEYWWIEIEKLLFLEKITDIREKNVPGMISDYSFKRGTSDLKWKKYINSQPLKSFEIFELNTGNFQRIE